MKYLSVLIGLFYLVCPSLKGQSGSFTELDIACSDGVSRPYIVYLPETRDANETIPLLVYLHGAISNPELKASPLEYMQKSPLLTLADAGPFALLFAYGQKGAGWFDPVGMEMVLGEVEAAVAQFPIDPDRIFLSGFSDGGSGALYFSMIHPDPFAGFISMNGHPKVSAKVGQAQIYPENMNRRPLYVINTKGDLLYPSQDLQPAINRLQKTNPKLIFRDLEGNHEMGYLPSEQEDLLAFIRGNHREPTMDISWETSDLQAGGMAWLTITELDTHRSPASWHRGEQLYLQDNRASFGIVFDYSYQGDGLLVKGFKNDSVTAVKMGIQEGDVIRLMGQDSIRGPYDPYFYMGSKKAGDVASVELDREGKTLRLEGPFNPPTTYELFQHRRKSGKVKATLSKKKLELETSRIATLWIDWQKFPFTDYANLKVSVNGKRIDLPLNPEENGVEIQIEP